MVKSQMEGIPVSEEHVAGGLGFASVQEFRRWNTEQGREIGELKHSVKQAQEEADRFQWHVKRMMLVLEKCKEHIWHGFHEREKLLTAINVVNGTGVDWHHIASDWLDEIKPRKRDEANLGRETIPGLEGRSP